jgi:hypothetical protein
VWTIKGGTYAGQVVRIDRNAATRRSSRFWRVSDNGDRKRIVGWNPSRLPARVAFRQGHRFSPADSAAFWDILRQMEIDMGMKLFEPATLPSDSDPDDLIVVGQKEVPSSDGLTLVTWGSNGALYDARVFFRSSDLLRSPSIVSHEMMHALGFGHTSSWVSVMNGQSRIANLTPADVAYAQVAFQSRVASEREDMWDRLALAILREPEFARRDEIGQACQSSSMDASAMPIRSPAVLEVVDAPDCLGERGTSTPGRDARR